MAFSQPETHVSSTGARFPSNGLYAFIRDDRNHNQCGRRISPPKSENGIENQARQEDDRQVGAELTLPRVRAHCWTVQSAADLLLSPRQKRHHDKSKTGEDNSGQTPVSGLFSGEMAEGFETNVCRQQEKTSADDAQREFLIRLATVYVRVCDHPPQQRDSGREFNKAVDTECYEGDATRDPPCCDSHESFESIPGNSEIFELASLLSQGSTVGNGRFRHTTRVNAKLDPDSKIAVCWLMS